MRTTAVLFPGQGSLTPGAAYPTRAAWPELVDRAAALLGEDPFEGAPYSTAFTQPAIFVTSMAAWRQRGDALSAVCAMAGHSLGELSALAAAGALTVDHALRLVVLRGRLMADAAAEHPGGGMVALLGAELDIAHELAARHGASVANDNAPGQVVLSGHRARLRRVTAEAREAGLRTMELDVTGSFHSSDMASAELPFLLALEGVRLTTPTVPVVSGFSARPFSDVPLERGGVAAAVHADVTDADACERAFVEIEQRFGPILGLVNNAGVRADNLALAIEDDEWDVVLETNLTAAFRMTRRVMRGMLRARYGRVVNIASVVGPRANPGQANYAASKAGLIGLTKTVATEVARKGITVNAVAPGYIETDMTAPIPDAVKQVVPARRPGRPEEVAACVRFLASDQASYVTGSTLYVDGGLAA